jgi:hypothetical protein
MTNLDSQLRPPADSGPGPAPGEGRFPHVPSLDAAKLSQYLRSAAIGFFLQRRLTD